MQKIKQLKSNFSAIQSEIAKFKEQKDECLKFKTFLEKLTPVEWKETKLEEKRARGEMRRRTYVDGRMKEVQEKMAAEIEAEEKKMEAMAQEAARAGRRKKKSELE